MKEQSDKRLLRVTAGNIRNNHIYIHEHFDFFPSDVVGGRRRIDVSDDSCVEIFLDGLQRTIRTDIASDGGNRPRRFFRGRKWVREFYTFHRTKPGDLLILERLAQRKYRLYRCDERLLQEFRNGMAYEPSARLATLRSIELFAGAGGLALGTARAGFDHLAVLEWDRNACETLRLNKAAGIKHVRDWKIWQGDVSQHDFRQYRGNIDLITGGPPCQPFSLGGKHRGHNDSRNMFPEAVRAVREIRPRAFIFENVKGLLRRNFANYYSYIIQQLEFPEVMPRGDEEWTDHLGRLQELYTSGSHDGARYNVVYHLLNSADYGVPQKRERVLIVGVRADLGVEFSFPHTSHSEDALLHDKWITGCYWDRHRVAKNKRPKSPDGLEAKMERLRGELRELMGEPWRTVRDAIRDIPRIAIGQTSAKLANHFLNPGARAYPGHTGSHLDEPAKALKAGDHGVPGGENTLRLEDGAIRYFSVRECARLQTFPDEWSFQGSWTESMRQLGNAVPVSLAQIVAKRLLQVIQPTVASKRTADSKR